MAMRDLTQIDPIVGIYLLVGDRLESGIACGREGSS